MMLYWEIAKLNSWNSSPSRISGILRGSSYGLFKSTTPVANNFDAKLGNFTPKIEPRTNPQKHRNNNARTHSTEPVNYLTLNLWHADFTASGDRKPCCHGYF